MIERLKQNRVALLAGVGSIVFIVIAETAWHVVNADYLQNLIPALGSALTATALVLMYRTARFINFTQLGLGAVGATLFFELTTRKLLPWGIAVPLGIIVGALVAVVVGLIMSLLFFKHPRLVLTVVSIVMLSLIAEIQGRVTGAFVKPGEVLVRPGIAGLTPFSKHYLDVDGQFFRVSWFIGVALIALLTVGLIIFFRRTRVGIAVRASAENADRASLLGVNVKALQVGVWVLVGLMASVGQIAHLGSGIGGSVPPAAGNGLLLLLPLAAAILAKMKSLPVAFVSAFGLEMVTRFVALGTKDPGYTNIAIVAVIALGLIVQRKTLATRVDEGSSWKAVKEVRAVPHEMLRVPAIRRGRIILILIGGALAIALPLIVSLGTVVDLTQVWILALVGVSLVVLTGWSGQISLGQYAMVTIGGLVAALMTSGGISFWLAAPIGGLAGAAFALVIGIPALRVRGLYLAIMTLGVAAVLPNFVFDQKFLGSHVPTKNLAAPTLFFLNFEDPRSMYFLCLVLFVVFVVAVQALRRSRGGRVLIAMRDNEDGVQSFGIDVLRTRLIAFALAGFMAAIAGAFLAHLNKGMTENVFGAPASLNVFIITVIGGIASPAGAFLGALYFVGGGLLFPGNLGLTTGIGGLMVLMFIPGGLTQIVFGARDAILRVVAMRKHIIVPSLFADYSPEAWEKRLAPLAPAVQSQGIGALEPDQRYRLPSKIFGRAPV